MLDINPPPMIAKIATTKATSLSEKPPGLDNFMDAPLAPTKAHVAGH
jgi:hypothetical protein